MSEMDVKLILQRLASIEYKLSKTEKQLKNLIPYKLDKRIGKLELWAEGKSKEAKKK